MRKAKFQIHFFCLSLALIAGCIVADSRPAFAQFYPNSGGSHYPGSPLYGSNSQYYNYYYYGGRQGKVSSLVDSRNNRQTKKATTWEAPTLQDNKIEQEIENTQVDYGVDSKEAIELIWKRAKQYNDTHQYEKALKLLDQLDPLLRKQENSLLIPGKEIQKLKASINAKLGNVSVFRLNGMNYRLGSGNKNSPISLDNFTFSDPRFNPYTSLSIPYGSANSKNSPQSKRNYYP